MGLNPRGRGRGRGGKTSFQNKNRRGGGMAGQGPMFRPGPPGMFCPPPGNFGGPPPDSSFGGSYYRGPPGFNYGPPRQGYGKFPRKNFKRKTPIKNNDAPPPPEIDLTKPWVTEEIKKEEEKKQECLETWRKTKDDGDWSKYKAQKQTVQTLYDKAKGEYLASHPAEAGIWQTETTTRKFYCETCDKTFRTDDDLIYHESEHETCGLEGCQFTAHPKIIAKHVKMQHDTGLFKRIGKLYTKEEIDKWIEERKKRYPSRKVIEEKKALEQEKINRGERINEDKSKFNKDFQKKNKKNKSFEKKTSKTSNNKRIRKRKKKPMVPLEIEDESPSVLKGVPAFVGIKKAFEPEETVEEEKDDLSISDDEWDNNDCHTETSKKPLLNNSLGLLAANYDSDEDDVEIKTENKVEEVSSDEGSAPEEVKTVKNTDPVPENNSEENKSSRKRKFDKKKDFVEESKRRNVIQNSSETRKLTLLEKLLKNEIRHERNVILQCIHYVIKNNFFKKS